MAIVVVAVDSDYEPITKAAFAYREKHVYPVVAQNGMTVVRCQGILARKYYFELETTKAGVAFVTGVGHGEYDKYMGDYQNDIMSVGGYDKAVPKGKIIHFLSCRTARILGPDAVANGCRAYLGYDENFAFFIADAPAFFECDAQIDLALAEGKTARQAYERAVARYNHHIAALMAAGKPYLAAVFQYNRDRLRSPMDGPLWGDPDARL